MDAKRLRERCMEAALADPALPPEKALEKAQLTVKHIEDWIEVGLPRVPPPPPPVPPHSVTPNPPESGK